MAELACVYDAGPAPAPPGPGSSPRLAPEKKTPNSTGKWLTAYEVTDDIAAVIAAAFGEAQKRDPGAAAGR